MLNDKEMKKLHSNESEALKTYIQNSESISDEQAQKILNTIMTIQ